jgi:hypothetical protein
MDDMNTPPEGPGEPEEPTSPSPPPPPAGEGWPARPTPGPGPTADPADAWVVGAPERAGSRWVKPFLIALGALVVVVGLAIAAIAFVLRGSSDVITAMVPDDASAYATVYLDPALGQKLALRDLVKRFPATDTSAELNARLQEFFDSAFQDSGLSFQADVKPWLGPQLGILGKADGADSSFAVLVASTDDQAAQAALSKLKSRLTEHEGETFVVQPHGGVDVTVGSSELGGQDAYALVSHTVVLGSSTDIVEEVIDTAQGKHPAIGGTSEYHKVFDALPKDKLAFAFVNAAPLIRQFEQSLGTDVLPAPGSFTALEAYRGAGMAITASSNGIAADFTVDIDPTKLTVDERQALAARPHANSVLAFTPRSAYAVFALESLKPSIQQAIDSVLEQSPDVQQTTDRYGLTGPDNVVDHLTGDAGLTVGPAETPDAFPGVALLAGTNDEAGMQRFLDAVAADVAGDLSGGSWQTEDYQGVTITYMPASPDDFFPISPAYAVGKGMAVVASSPEEVKSILDARAGTNITASPNYAAAIADSVPNATSLFYVDVESVAAAVRDQLPPDEQATYDADVGPNLRHLKAFVFSGSSTTDHQTVRMFLLVK